MARAWQTPCESHTAKLVLLKLADNANDQGLCWPSISTVAEHCGLSGQGVRNQIRRLEVAGLIKTERSAGRKSNRYHLFPTLNAVCCKPPTPLRVQPPTPLRDTPHRVGGKPPTPLPSTPHAVEPNRKEPSLEPSVNLVAADAVLCPTFEEVKEFAACNGITFESAKSFFEHHEGKNLWQNKYNRPINWRKEVAFWSDRDRSGFRPSTPASNPNPTKYINDPNSTPPT